MRTPVYTKRFGSDLKRMIKRGNKPEKIKAVIRDLIDGKTLDQKHRDHMLIGNSIINHRSLTPRQAPGNALAAEFKTPIDLRPFQDKLYLTVTDVSKALGIKTTSAYVLCHR